MNFQRQMDMIADTLSITRAELDELSVQEVARRLADRPDAGPRLLAAVRQLTPNRISVEHSLDQYTPGVDVVETWKIYVWDEERRSIVHATYGNATPGEALASIRESLEEAAKNEEADRSIVAAPPDAGPRLLAAVRQLTPNMVSVEHSLDQYTPGVDVVETWKIYVWDKEIQSIVHSTYGNATPAEALAAIRKSLEEAAAEAAKNEEADLSIVAASTTAEACT